jgi:hypothetical protein
VNVPTEITRHLSESEKIAQRHSVMRKYEGRPVEGTESLRSYALMMISVHNLGVRCWLQAGLRQHSSDI